MPERFFEIGFALSNSAPPDAVQIRFVNQSAEAHRATRLISINVIERQSGIETVPPTKIDAIAQTTGCFQSGTRNCEFDAAAQLQSFVFLPGVAASIGLEK